MDNSLTADQQLSLSEREAWACYVAVATKGNRAANFRRQSPSNNQEFQTPWVPQGLGLGQSEEKSASKALNDEREARGNSQWLVIMDSQLQNLRTGINSQSSLD